jgi:hypothetical protein
MVSVSNLCQCITKDGMNCKMRVKPGQRYCHHHKNCDELKSVRPAKRAGARAVSPKSMVSPKRAGARASSPKRAGARAMSPKELKELNREFEDLQIDEYEPGSVRSRRSSFYDDYEPGSVRRMSPNNGRRMSPNNVRRMSPVEEKMNPLLASLLGLDAGYRPLVSLIDSYASGYYKATFRFREGNTKTILLKLDALIPEYNFIPNRENPEIDFILKTKLPGVFSTYSSFVLISLEEIYPREFYDNEGLPKTEITIKDIDFRFLEIYHQPYPGREDNRPGGEYVKIKPSEMKLLGEAEDAIRRKDYDKFKKLLPRLRLRHLNKLYDKVPVDDMKMVEILFGMFYYYKNSFDYGAPIILNIRTHEFSQYLLSVLESAILKDNVSFVNLVILHLRDYPINIILLEHLLELSKSRKELCLAQSSLQRNIDEIKTRNNL